MKKLFILLSFLLTVLVDPTLAQTEKAPAQKKETIVYVCDSKTSYAYHTSSSCRGLNRCTHQIIKMNESDAKKQKRTPCKVCH